MQTNDPTLVGKIIFVRPVAAPRAVKQYVVVGYDRGGLHVVSMEAALDADTFEGGSYIGAYSYQIIGVLSDDERISDLLDFLEATLNDPNAVWTGEVREGLTRKIKKLGVILAHNLAAEDDEEDAEEDEARAAGEAAAEELERQRVNEATSEFDDFLSKLFNGEPVEASAATGPTTVLVTFPTREEAIHFAELLSKGQG